jgi:hypothetical protein
LNSSLKNNFIFLLKGNSLLSKKSFELPKDILDLYPPLTRQKVAYKSKVTRELKLPFSYNSALWIKDYENDLSRLQIAGWGKVLDGGVFDNDTFMNTLSGKYSFERHVYPKGSDGEWIAFEYGMYFSGVTLKLGPIPYDSIVSHSFDVKPSTTILWPLTRKDGILTITIEDSSISEDSDNISFKIRANSPNIRNLAAILNAVGVVQN